ncbi:hypothetical protein GCM10011349_39240 [Novosphingobium indicum]|uniref:Uncharacterized protein n=1 Tax=Novosphingobium indicum TaxID=462949 RepID=A0ABQ2JYP0_9SPHN|nr:hypothetical protein [Novosphingobium indicum]GGN59066.1 hypothetical protein GCM10011349_39240 [Novosphingobium indicum]
MGILISKAFVRQVIQDRWGAVGELEQGWAERVATGLQKVGEFRDRKTIYRWLSRGLPNDRDSIFGFAATLGVDPLVMLDIENPKFQQLLQVEWFFFLANLANSGKLSAFWPLVRPAVDWPNPEISHDFYDSTWATIEFRHTADQVRNVFAQLRITGDAEEAEFTAHRVYYLAYRRQGARDGLWRPYGIVRKRGRRAICLAHNGDMWEDENGKPTEVIVDDGGSLDIETFFGPGPCEFKVACLHPFALDVVAPSRAGKALRFSA